MKPQLDIYWHPCALCHNGFRRALRIPGKTKGRLQIYCSATCRRRATRQRAKAHEKNMTL